MVTFGEQQQLGKEDVAMMSLYQKNMQQSFIQSANEAIEQTKKKLNDCSMSLSTVKQSTSALTHDFDRLASQLDRVESSVRNLSLMTGSSPSLSSDSSSAEEEEDDGASSVDYISSGSSSGFGSRSNSIRSEEDETFHRLVKAQYVIVNKVPREFVIDMDAESTSTSRTRSVSNSSSCSMLSAPASSSQYDLVIDDSCSECSSSGVGSELLDKTISDNDDAEDDQDQQDELQLSNEAVKRRVFEENNQLINMLVHKTLGGCKQCHHSIHALIP